VVQARVATDEPVASSSNSSGYEDNTFAVHTPLRVVDSDSTSSSGDNREGGNASGPAAAAAALNPPDSDEEETVRCVTS